ncbi:MAG TPA: MFS transporter [Acidimicrobiales bacterium]|nr:MFS transporter [Acidimicrobiales bacterium]
MKRRTVLIAAIVGLAKADAAAMGVVAPALKSHLHISEAELGLLASMAAATGALASLPAGTLVDRRHRVSVVTIALIGWSLALGLAGFARGLFLLAVARILSGGIATVARPVAVSLTGDFHQTEERGRALAILDAGQAVGTAVCFMLGALAVHLLNWRWLFFWLAVIGVGMSVAVSRLSEPVRTGLAAPPLRVMLKLMITIRTNRIVLIADSVGNFFYAGAASFAVLFISERYHLSNATVDALAPILAVGVIAGILAGGRVGDRLTRRRGGEERVVVAAACQLTATALFAAALFCGTVLVASVFLFFGATVLGGAGPCLDAVRLDIVPAGMRGRAEAARGLLLLGSGALGPLTFGLMATAFGGRSGGLALRDAFLVMLGPLAAGALVLLAAVRPYRDDARAAEERSLFPVEAPDMLEG